MHSWSPRTESNRLVRCRRPESASRSGGVYELACRRGSVPLRVVTIHLCVLPGRDGRTDLSALNLLRVGVA